MTETAAIPPTENHQSDPLFVRPREGRIVGGVCAGIAQRWGFDLTLVRVVTVVLAVASGVGVAAYLAAWLLTPSTDSPAPLSSGSDLAESVSRGRRRFGRRLPQLIGIGIVALLLLAVLHGIFWWSWGWGWGAPVGLIVVALVTAAVVGTRGGRWLLAALVTLLLVAVGSVAAFGPHFGTRTYHVSSTDQLRSSYEYGAGRVNLDLSSLSVAGRHRTEVRLGRGSVVVTVPTSTAVVVHARAGVGSVTVDGHEVSGFDAEQTQTLGDATAADQLTVDVLVGAGDVDVRTA